jgi:hypothetical protein
MFGYTAFPSIYGPSLTGIAGTARVNDCLRPGYISNKEKNYSHRHADFLPRRRISIDRHADWPIMCS